MENLGHVFGTYAEELEKEQTVRESLNVIVKQLDKISHVASTRLEKVHHVNGVTKVEEIGLGCMKDLCEVPTYYKKLYDELPASQFHRYHLCFKSVTHKLVFLHAFLIYLTENRLGTYEEIAAYMGLTIQDNEGLHLDLEDYLYGCLFLGNELSRLAINSVSSGNFAMPFQISDFLRELHTAYSLLNPKHDLRKKFDELKYSLKKTEEVVFDLSVRGLKPTTSQDTSG